MNFRYDLTLDALWITLRETDTVLTQNVTPNCNVDIDGDGQVCRILITHPGPANNRWPTKEILERYPLTVNESYFFITLSERSYLFKF